MIVHFPLQNTLSFFVWCICALFLILLDCALLFINGFFHMDQLLFSLFSLLLLLLLLMLLLDAADSVISCIEMFPPCSWICSCSCVADTVVGGCCVDN